MPFAGHPGRVALLLQKLRDRHLCAREAVLRRWAKGAMNPYPIGITAGQQPRPRRGAYRLGHVEIGELSTLLRHSIQIRRRPALCAKGSDVGIALVVDENDHDVRKTRRGPRGPREKHKTEKEQGEA